MKKRTRTTKAVRVCGGCGVHDADMAPCSFCAGCLRARLGLRAKRNTRARRAR